MAELCSHSIFETSSTVCNVCIIKQATNYVHSSHQCMFARLVQGFLNSKCTPPPDPSPTPTPTPTPSQAFDPDFICEYPYRKA